VRAAPVQVSWDHLRDGRAAAVVLNSGNANAATGEQGRQDARRMCDVAGESLGCGAQDVLVCSTGLIGVPLPMDPIEAGLPKLAGEIGSAPEAAAAAADAILTTDTVRKESDVQLELANGTVVTVGAMAKGAAMLSPAMATMLAVLTTDAAVEPRALHQLLEHAVDVSFNQMSIDASTSTNDTVLLLAGGAAGNPTIGSEGSRSDLHALTDAVAIVCEELALQMARDAEGATKQVQVLVEGARSSEEARRAARAVASSQLVQCSLNGADPYWGRILSELGASGARVDPESVDIADNGVVVCRDGIAAPHDDHDLAAAMAERWIEIRCDLNLGMGEARVLTTDLSHAYIDENRRTS
jgi:glutamate N-acetyltransferase/amino-acid N-acetyltransferase